MEKVIYTAFAPANDMTFIMCDFYEGEELISTECVGWHYGSPEVNNSEDFIGKLKAEYGEIPGNKQLDEALATINALKGLLDDLAAQAIEAQRLADKVKIGGDNAPKL